MLCGFRLPPHHPKVSPLPDCPNIHFCIPAVIVECHLLVKSLPTAVRRVHLWAGWEAWSSSGHTHPQLPSVPCSWLDSCLLQYVLNEAD